MADVQVLVIVRNSADRDLYAVVSVVRGEVEGKNTYGEDIRHAIAFARSQLVEGGPHLGKEARKSGCVVLGLRILEIDIPDFGMNTKIKGSQNKIQTYTPSKP